MKNVFVAVFVSILALGLSVGDAEAARFGGGKSFGMQRQSVAPRPATPARQATPAPTPAPAAAPAPTPKRNWMGPLAGLAAGLGIGALLSHFGMGGGMGNLLMIALLAMAAFFVFKLLFRRNTPTAQHAEPLQYAGAGNPANTPTPQAAAPFGSAAPAVEPAELAAVRVPDGFDGEAFLRVAKLTSSVCRPPTTPKTSTTSVNSPPRKFSPRSRCKWTNAAAPRSRPTS